MFKKLHGKFIDWWDSENLFFRIVASSVGICLVAATLLALLTAFAFFMVYIAVNNYVLLTLGIGVIGILLWTLIRFIIFCNK